MVSNDDMLAGLLKDLSSMKEDEKKYDQFNEIMNQLMSSRETFINSCQSLYLYNHKIGSDNLLYKWIYENIARTKPDYFAKLDGRYQNLHKSSISFKEIRVIRIDYFSFVYICAGVGKFVKGPPNGLIATICQKIGASNLQICLGGAFDPNTNNIHHKFGSRNDLCIICRMSAGVASDLTAPENKRLSETSTTDITEASSSSVPPDLEIKGAGEDDEEEDLFPDHPLNKAIVVPVDHSRDGQTKIIHDLTESEAKSIEQKVGTEKGSLILKTLASYDSDDEEFILNIMQKYHKHKQTKLERKRITDKIAELQRKLESLSEEPLTITF